MFNLAFRFRMNPIKTKLNPLRSSFFDSFICLRLKPEVSQIQVLRTIVLKILKGYNLNNHGC